MLDLLPLLLSLAPLNPSCAADLALFTDGTQTIAVQVEIADDPAERARGLMGRTELADGQGMLFIYEQPQPVAFWMRNTLIPLDMVFIDDTGTIRHIHRNAVPLDETGIPGATPDDTDPNRLMVLEVGGGQADALGLDIGQTLLHPALDQSLAVTPCP